MKISSIVPFSPVSRFIGKNVVKANPALSNISFSKILDNDEFEYRHNDSHKNPIEHNTDAYDDYVRNNPGAVPPAIERAKGSLTYKAQKCIEQGDYLEAIRLKIEIANICKKQGKERDAFITEEGIRALYANLRVKDSFEAKKIIATYNEDMAKFIDQDIASGNYQ